MDRIEAAMKFELEAHKKLRLKLEELAQQSHDLRVQCARIALCDTGHNN